jgi:hypothetical protein
VLRAVVTAHAPDEHQLGVTNASMTRTFSTKTGAGFDRQDLAVRATLHLLSQ